MGVWTLDAGTIKYYHGFLFFWEGVLERLVHTPGLPLGLLYGVFFFGGFVEFTIISGAFRMIPDHINGAHFFSFWVFGFILAFGGFFFLF